MSDKEIRLLIKGETSVFTPESLAQLPVSAVQAWSIPEDDKKVWLWGIEQAQTIMRGRAKKVWRWGDV